MMQQLRNPKNVKMISLFVAAIFVLSCFAITVQQGSFSSIASAASSESAIGVVNYQMLLSQSPEPDAPVAVPGHCRCAGSNERRNCNAAEKF